jgi:hypothetical protein
MSSSGPLTSRVRGRWWKPHGPQQQEAGTAPGSGLVATKRCTTTVVSWAVEGAVEAAPEGHVELQSPLFDIADLFTHA